MCFSKSKDFIMTNQTAIMHFNSEARRGSPLLWWVCVALLAGMLGCYGLQLADARLIAGVSVWEKPAKFFLSLIVQAGTLAWAISLLQRPARGIKAASWIFIAAIVLEMAYMLYRASRAEASHFNTETPFAAIMYTVMGIGAISLTITSGFIGWRVWQQREGNVMREAAGFGLMLGALLGTIAGGYLSSQTSHWIGGDLTDATGLGFFHWSTTGGDLRVAHFIGLHATQAVPLAALSGNRWVVYGVAALCAIAMATAFGLATMGMPVLRG
jgi:hypothetical protein